MAPCIFFWPGILTGRLEGATGRLAGRKLEFARRYLMLAEEEKTRPVSCLALHAWRIYALKLQSAADVFSF